jgi:hypothetical protein
MRLLRYKHLFYILVSFWKVLLFFRDESFVLIGTSLTGLRKALERGELGVFTFRGCWKTISWSAPACWCGFSKNVSSWNIRELRFQKIAKASFRTPKNHFSTRPLGEPYKSSLIFEAPSPLSMGKVKLKS